MDEAKASAFTDRVFGEVTAALGGLNMVIGLRLGLFAALHSAGSTTASQLAGRAGLNERYVDEWLRAMAASGYIDYEPSSGAFSISDEHAAVLIDKDSPFLIGSLLHVIPSIAGILPQLQRAFRSGGGVPFSSYEGVVEAIGDSNRPMFLGQLASWIEELPDIKARLEAGGRIADIGCGTGWSTIAESLAFPASTIDGVDPDHESIENARANAARSGVEGRVRFHAATAEEAGLDAGYDLVTAFECIHDMAYPVPALKRARELLAPEGAMLIADELAEDRLEDNINPLGSFLYNVSVLHCLPASMAFPGAAGTGTAMGPTTLRQYADEAGFSKVDVLPIENPFWRFYRLTP